MILGREKIMELIKEKGLIKNFVDLETQLQPNGFDLTVGKIYEIKNRGSIDFSNKERKLPEFEEILPEKLEGDRFGWWNLEKGVYKVKINEILKLPLDLTGFALPRGSLLRMGAFVVTGHWDLGFEGESEFLLKVDNPFGIKIKENAGILQIAFIKSTGTTKGYDGIYKKTGMAL